MGWPGFWRKKRPLWKSEYTKKGKEYLELQMYEEAIEEFKKAVRFPVEEIEPFYYLGETYYKQGQNNQAKEFFLKTIQLQPDEDIVKRMCALIGMRRIVSDKYYNASPSFSPDGKQIVFCSARRDTNGDGKLDALDNKGIYVVDTKGQGERQIVSDRWDNANPLFSPDGKMVVFLSRRHGANQDGKINYLDNWGIYLLNLATGEEEQLVSDAYQNKFPSFSPSGEKILYCSWRARNSGIYLWDLKQHREEQIVSEEYDNTFPTFSRRGNRILYASWRSDTNGDGVIDLRDNSGVYILDLSTGREWRAISDEYSNMFPTFSPDGKQILFLSLRRDTNKDGKIDALDNCGIFTIDITGRNEQCIVSDEYFNKFPSFSSDGEKILYLSSGDPGGFFKGKAIFLKKIGAKYARRIISSEYFGHTSPVFSPTGQQIVYLAWREKTNRGVYLAPADGIPTKDELIEIVNNNVK